MTTTDTYLTVTPFGTVDAVFEADGTGVDLQGPADAVAHIKRVMATACDHRGMTITTDSVEPATYFDFCQPEGSGVVIMEPADMALDPRLDSMVDDDEDDFDGQEEFDAIPADADPEGDTEPVMDGDFKGHPFRGNQHRKAGRESGAAVGASIKAKRAERKGDKKALKSAHRGAHYAHLAAAEGATGKALKYHRTMAKFHGKQSGAVLDAVLDAAKNPIMVRITSRGQQIGTMTPEEFRKAAQAPKTMGLADVIKRFNEWKAEQGEPERAEDFLVGANKRLDAAVLDKADPDMLQKSKVDKVDTRGPVNVFSEGDKVISLDDNKDYTVTGQRGLKVSVKGRSDWIHANRLKLASGKKPPTIVMDDAVLDDATLDAAEGAYLGQEKKGIAAAAALLKYLRAFVRSDKGLAKNPMREKFGFTSDDVINKAQAQAMLTKLIDVAVSRKGGDADLTSDQQQALRDFQHDARIIEEYFEKRMHRGSGRNQLRTKEMKARYPEIDNPDDHAEYAQRGGRLDGVEELPALRAQLATATSTMERLRLAQAIKAARTAPPAPPPAPADNDASRVNALKRLVPKDDIRSDDPQLIEKLTAKLNYLSAWGDFMRKANKLLRKGDDAGLLAMGFTAEQLPKFKAPGHAGDVGFAPYMMSNNNGVIGSTRKRLEAAMRDREPAPVNVPISIETVRLLAEPLSITVDVTLSTAGGSLEMADLKLGAVKAVLEWKTDPGQYELRGRTPDGQEWQTAGNGMGNMLREFAAWAGRFIPAAPPAGRFRYALVNRPADLGAIPKVPYTVEPRPAAGQPHHDMARHGILVTERELTAQEVKAFELAPLIDGDNLATLAGKIADGMAEYAARYVEIEKEDPAEFYNAVMGAVRQSGSGIRYSIGDPDGLVRMVLDKLKAGVPAPQPEPTPARDGESLWNALTDEARASALANALAQYGTPATGKPNGAARSLSAKSWADVPEAGRPALIPYLSIETRRAGNLRPKPSPPPEPSLPIEPEQKERDTRNEANIGGVEFIAVRRDLPRPHWTARVKRTGEDMPQTYDSRADMWADLERSAKAIGDRWVSDFEPKQPTADPQRTADLALLTLVSSGKHPDMLEPELAEQIEAVLARHADDKAIQDLGERAITAYSNGAVEATN